ncbi:MAG: type I-E CRISPR-associated protein Cas6/Cse3/CasE [Phototrophicales bacterium]|nr:MAG: type I-E CRISPR-associated protein Cas6/Cse3/CasE [Phototrophicales bacterium]RMG70783.1 MAG: type I-E CRISPR-associated protein Cas6/Cse3/CasE [Chloroflexota bacterium]
MYLSQLVLNPRSREARFDLSDRYELHRTLMTAFPAQLSADERVLYRVEDRYRAPGVSVLVQSLEIPTWEQSERLNQRQYMLEAPQVRHVQPVVQQGQVCRFRLQANPTVKRDGKRHAIYQEDALFTWLVRKGQQHGFTFDQLDVRAAKLGKRFGKKRSQTWHVVQFDGVLKIIDAAAFNEALINGIGSGKAFGFGLLSIPYPIA